MFARESEAKIPRPCLSVSLKPNWISGRVKAEPIFNPTGYDEFRARLPFEIESLAVGVVEFEIEAELQAFLRKDLFQKAIAIATIEYELAFFDRERDLELLRLFGQKKVGGQACFADFESCAIRATNQECQPFILSPGFCQSERGAEASPRWNPWPTGFPCR